MRAQSSGITLWSILSKKPALSRYSPPSKYLQRCPYSSVSDSSSSLPRIAQPSLWTSMIPKFLREPRSPGAKPREKKGWNPYTFHIIAFLLIGSNAMNQIALRREFTNYSRKADAKISLLEDVIRRVHKGEDVDIEKALGTGDPEQEKEWEEGWWTFFLCLKAAMHCPWILEKSLLWSPIADCILSSHARN